MADVRAAQIRAEAATAGDFRFAFLQRGIMERGLAPVHGTQFVRRARNAVDPIFQGGQRSRRCCGRPMARLEQNRERLDNLAREIDAVCARHCSIWNQSAEL